MFPFKELLKAYKWIFLQCFLAGIVIGLVIVVLLRKYPFHMPVPFR